MNLLFVDEQGKQKFIKNIYISTWVKQQKIGRIWNYCFFYHTLYEKF